MLWYLLAIPDIFVIKLLIYFSNPGFTARSSINKENRKHIVVTEIVILSTNDTIHFTNLIINYQQYCFTTSAKVWKEGKY